MLQIFIFIVYLLLCVAFFRHYRFEKDTGLSKGFIVLFFLAKVLAGTANLLVHFNSVVTNDVGFFYWQSINELKAMHRDPGFFFREWLGNWGTLRDGLNIHSPNFSAFWKDLGVLLHSKYMTLANILSLGNQYVNVIVYNIPFFIGQLYLYKAFYRLQPERKGMLVLVFFCIPSILFWCSGIHKDGWIVTAFGLIIYGLSRLLEQRKGKYLFSLVAGVLLLFIVRNFYLLLLFPLLILWVLTNNKKNIFPYYAVGLIVTLVLFFNIHRIIPGINPMEHIKRRQTEFVAHIGYSDMKTPLLENNFRSYLSNLPTALDHIFLQPHFHVNSRLKYQLAALDNYFVLLLMGFLIVYIRPKYVQRSMYLSLVLYSLSVYLFIGYTIPNCGALIRYKSEFSLLLLATLVSLSDNNKLSNLLNQWLFRFEKSKF